MKDIFEILKDNGIDVETEKHTEIRKAFAENYKTINEHNQKIEKLTEQVNTANGTIKDLNEKLEDASKVDVKALQDRIKKFEDAEADRVKKENEQKETEALKARFSPLKGENKFLNEGTENWIFGEFKNALSLDENKGKSDADIYAAITKDKNIYENPNGKFINPPAGGKGSEKAEFKKFF
jgi:TolA-binding protein